MRNLNTGLIVIATSIAVSVAAQEPPTPPARPARPAAAPRVAPQARTPRPDESALAAPLAAPEPFALMPSDFDFAMPSLAPLAPMPPMDALTPMAALAPMEPLAPMAPMAPMPPMDAMTPLPALAPAGGFFEFQGGSRPRVQIDRSEIDRIAEQARTMAREQAQMAREDALAQSQAARELAREQAQSMREQALQSGAMARAQAAIDRASQSFGQRFGQSFGQSFSQSFSQGFGQSFGHGLSDRPPSAWAQRDPADSLYRAAQEAMNRGDYRKAANIFKEIPTRFQYSAYAADAMYWTAHALYRIGSTPDLQDALAQLELLKTKYPNSRLRNSQNDVGALQVRIAGVLSSRGQGGSDIVKRALSQNTNVCDSEEQQIRAAALNALMQTDPDAAADYAQKMLSRKDDCSREMRRTAVFLIGNKGDPKATATLISVAKSDPSPDVRSSAVQYLGRMPGDDALGALEELAKSDTESQVQREAIRQLARNSSPRARTAIKSLVERSDVSDNLRITALDALDPDHSTQDDVAWLQAAYTKIDSPRVRSRLIGAMARIGGAQNEKWFATLANNENESIDVRVEALRRAGQTMDIAALSRLYDQTGQRELRIELVRQLGNRREPEALDKLGDIAKNGTDPEVRRHVISVLSNNKDPRATKLLLSLIDRP